MSRVLYRIGHFAGRHPWRVIAAWLLVAAAVFMLNSSIGGQPDETFSLPGAESQRAADAIRGPLPAGDPLHLQRDLPLRGGPVRPGHQGGRRTGVTEKLAEGPHVIAVNSPYDPRGPTVSEDGQRRSPRSLSTPRRSASTTTTPPRTPSRRSATRVSRSSTTTVSATPKVRRRAQQRADRHPGRRRRAGHRVRIAGRDEPADRGRAGGDRDRHQHDRHPVRARSRSRDRQHRRHDARPRSRHRLRAVHPRPAPSEPRVRA